MSKRPRLKVVKIPISNRRSIKDALERAAAAGLTDIIIIGYDATGEFWTEINFVHGGDALWLLELCKAKLMHRPIQQIIKRLP